MDFNEFICTFGLWVIFIFFALLGAAWFERRYRKATITVKENE